MQKRTLEKDHSPVASEAAAPAPTGLPASSNSTNTTHSADPHIKDIEAEPPKLPIVLITEPPEENTHSVDLNVSEQLGETPKCVPKSKAIKKRNR